MTESISPRTPINNRELARIMIAFFSLDELNTLCHDLSVDPEEIRGQTKSERVWAIIQHLEQRGRLDKLIEEVLRLRPHVNLNLEKIIAELFPPDDPRIPGVQSILEQLRQYIQKLHEWKELHNQLDETINVFGQYRAQVERLAVVGRPLNDLDLIHLSWQPVDHRLKVLLIWAEQDVKYIGTPYRVLDSGERVGEKWAIELAKQYTAILALLADNPLSITYSGLSNRRWQHFVNSVGLPSSQNTVWHEWWHRLRELTRAFDSSLKSNMFLADKELRKVATELFHLSRETLWS